MPPTGPARETAAALHSRLPMTMAIAAVLSTAVVLAGCEQEIDEAPNVRPVRTVTVDKRAAGTPIVLTGRIEAKDEVVLAFRISGRLLNSDLGWATGCRLGRTLGVAE